MLATWHRLITSSYNIKGSTEEIGSLSGQKRSGRLRLHHHNCFGRKSYVNPPLTSLLCATMGFNLLRKHSGAIREGILHTNKKVCLFVWLHDYRKTNWLMLIPAGAIDTLLCVGDAKWFCSIYHPGYARFTRTHGCTIIHWYRFVRMWSLFVFVCGKRVH